MMVMDREWREAADLRPSHVGLALALLAAALLRVWSLGHGLPYEVGVDEPAIMIRAVRMLQTGDFNPHFFDYPSFYIYVQMIVAVCHFLIGAVRGQWPSLGSVTAGDFYLWGRAVTALVGTATVFLLHLAGLRWGARTALLSAALLAVMPLHVRESHFVLTDVPVTFFVTLTFLLSLVAHERATLGPFLAAAAAAGLATATKYNGLLALVMPLIACWMTLSVKPSRWLVSLAIMATAALCFLLVVPYSVLDLPTFLDQFARLSTAYNLPTRPSHQFLSYLKHLRNAWHWPASLMVIGGLILGLVRAIKGPGRVKWTLLIVFPTLYMAFVSRQSLLYGRYLLPMVPFLSLLAAAAVVSGVSLLRRYEIPRQARSALIVALVLLAVAPPAYTSISYDVDAAKVWTTNAGLRLDRAGSAQRRENHGRDRGAADPLRLSRRLRQAIATGAGRGVRGGRHGLSRRLVAGLRPVRHESTGRPDRVRTTTSGCFRRRARSHDSRRRRRIPVRSCAS